MNDINQRQRQHSPESYTNARECKRCAARARVDGEGAAAVLAAVVVVAGVAVSEESVACTAATSAPK